jgi:hypothetical protein
MRTLMAAPELEDFSSRRVVFGSALLVAIGAALELVILGSPEGALSLTAAGAVAIINFRWLEQLLHAVIQPDRPRFDGRSVLRMAGRMLLLAGIMAALLWVPRIDPVAVTLGFTALVVALLWEGIRWGRVGGG